MTRKTVAAISSVFVLVAALATLPVAARKGEPDVVKVQHILIGFKKTIPNKELDRSRRDAGRLAKELLKRAQSEEDFEALIKEYSDDRGSGTILIANDDATVPAGGIARQDLVPSFGDLSFKLGVGEIDIVGHHVVLSPFGYHVIKRIE